MLALNNKCALSCESCCLFGPFGSGQILPGHGLQKVSSLTVSKQELRPELQTSIRTLQCGTLFLLASSSSSSSSKQADSLDDILSPINQTHATLVSE